MMAGVQPRLSGLGFLSVKPNGKLIRELQKVEA